MIWFVLCLCSSCVSRWVCLFAGNRSAVSAGRSEWKWSTSEGRLEKKKKKNARAAAVATSNFQRPPSNTTQTYFRPSRPRHSHRSTQSILPKQPPMARPQPWFICVPVSDQSRTEGFRKGQKEKRAGESSELLINQDWISTESGLKLDSNRSKSRTKQGLNQEPPKQDSGPQQGLQ